MFFTKFLITFYNYCYAKSLVLAPLMSLIYFWFLFHGEVFIMSIETYFWLGMYRVFTICIENLVLCKKGLFWKYPRIRQGRNISIFLLFVAFTLILSFCAKDIFIFIVIFPLWTNFILNFSGREACNRNSYTWTIKNFITKEMRLYAIV